MKNILVITPTFFPDIGGVETHLSDLTKGLGAIGNLRVTVVTLKPIVTKGIKSYKKKEVSKNLVVYRFWWIGGNLFHFFESYPFLQFLYLCPYLFIRTFFILLFKKEKIDVIHGQGLTGAWVGLVIKKIFHKKLVVSTHAIYKINRNSLITRLIKYTLNQSDEILCLSEASRKQLVNFSVNKEKIHLYKQWIDLDSFKPLDKNNIREVLKIENKFSVLFIGRLIEMKGIKVLIEVAKKNENINFIFVGHGPLENYLINVCKVYKNVIFLGSIENEDICQYYNLGDIFCLPSQEDEGFGRVIMEALACGIPVIGSNKGGIPEALDESVSIVVEPTFSNLDMAIKTLYFDKDRLLKMKNNARSYAFKNFSKNNIYLIISHY
jgi:glycosyltransferase involved in cell wall biosynthesis